MALKPERPRSSFKASQEGLAVAKSLADAMSIEMDMEQTRRLADELHRRYYQAILKLLHLPDLPIAFDAGSLRMVSAFAEATLEGQAISFDEQLDFWLMTCAHLTAVATCKVLTPAQFEELVVVFAQNLEVALDPHQHEQMRKSFAPWLMEHTDVLELSHALSRAMIVFVLCHELAHVQLGHTAGAATAANEVAADQLAAEHFLKIIAAGEGAGLIFVHRKLVVAPIVMMRFREILHHYKARKTGRPMHSRTHPPPSTRGLLLRQHLAVRLDQDARYLLDGLMAGLADISNRLQL